MHVPFLIQASTAFSLHLHPPLNRRQHPARHANQNAARVHPPTPPGSSNGRDQCSRHHNLNWYRLKVAPCSRILQARYFQSFWTSGVSRLEKTQSGYALHSFCTKLAFVTLQNYTFLNITHFSQYHTVGR